MFFFWNPCAHAELHQRKRARKLCSATLNTYRITDFPTLLYTSTCEIPLIYLKREKGTPFGRSLSVSAIIGSISTPPPPGTRILTDIISWWNLHTYNIRFQLGHANSYFSYSFKLHYQIIVCLKLKTSKKCIWLKLSRYFSPSQNFYIIRIP